jgi:hypothetical protein
MRYFVALTMAAAVLQAAVAFGVVKDNVKLTVVTAPQGKSDKGGKTVRAEALVERINTSEQLKVVALEVLDHLKSTYPDCHSFTVALSDDARMMKIGYYLAVARFKEGKTSVTGGIPTNMDIRVMKASRLDIRKPDALGVQIAYESAMLKKEAVQKGKKLSDKNVYALVAKKHKMQAMQIRQIDRGIAQYYKAFEGKPF